MNNESQDLFLDLIQQAVIAERRACLAICMEAGHLNGQRHLSYWTAVADISNAIRARGPVAFNEDEELPSLLKPQAN